MGDKNDDKKGASGAGDENPAGDETDLETTDESLSEDLPAKTVSRSAYEKSVSEAKKARERARKLAEENETLKAKALEGETNKDEKLKTLSQQLAEEKKRSKSLLGATVKKALSSQVKAEATKAGSIDADAVMRLLDLSDVEVDQETLEADGDLLATKVAELKKSKPYLFSKAGAKINQRMPSGKSGDDEESERPDYSKLTQAQIREKLREMDKKR